MGIFQSMQDEVDDRDKRDGISLAEMLDLEPLQRRLAKQITRKGELGIEEAAKLVISAGLVSPEYQTRTKELARKSRDKDKSTPIAAE